MIVITNPTAIANEINIINILFKNGLELLHIRKPELSEVKTALFIHQIKKEYWQKLVLHDHHHLAAVFGITHIHFSETKRKETKPDSLLKTIMFLSTSTHSIEEFNSLSNVFDYAFLSPVFPSISKENYQSETNLLETIKNRTNFDSKLFALSGIESGNITQVLNSGFDDVALLGTIWNSKHPIENFKKCQEIVLSY
ncbi:thiamine phosphate synthase [Flavobacterium adhaerens]|uniref:thiamine phosphate synthase n=1 Tax=Flavobacterium adhaerens TaxID=3149043 RepID=UPI0032B389C6